jgi:hypothetical protein|tara:strand:- start:1847 stop:2026 length:180 start_codon:yes stop_codon:yes gene_type:complete
MAKSEKLIEVKLSEDEICELINGLMVRKMGGGLDKNERKLGRKLSAALKKIEKKSVQKA